MRHVQRTSHGRGSFGYGFKPYWEFGFLLYSATKSIIQLLDALFNARWVIGNLAQLNNITPSQGSTEARSYIGSVTDHGNVIKVTDSLTSGALDDQIVEQKNNGVGHTITLALAVTAAMGSTMDPDWSIRKTKQLGFVRLISAE